MMGSILSTIINIFISYFHMGSVPTVCENVEPIMPVHARKKLVHGRQFAHALSLARANCSYLFVAGAFQMSHLGQNKINLSFESERRQSLVLQLQQQSSCFVQVIAWLIVILARFFART